LRQTEAAYSTEVLLGPNGDADWKATADSLSELDSAIRSLGTIPGPLEDALSDPNRIDRGRAKNALAEILNAEALLARTWSGVVTIVNFGLAEGEEPRLPDHSPRDFSSWCAGLLEDVDADIHAVDTLLSLMRVDYNCTLAEAPGLLRNATERAQIRDTVAKLPLPSDHCGGLKKLSESDWQQDTINASALLQYFEKCPGELSLAARRALTDANATDSCAGSATFRIRE
jgi:hypothetical protein